MVHATGAGGGWMHPANSRRAKIAARINNFFIIAPLRIRNDAKLINGVGFVLPWAGFIYLQTTLFYMSPADLTDVGYAGLGTPPGTLIYSGDRRSDKGKITVTTYHVDGLEEKSARTVKQAAKLLKKPGVKWINVYGLHNIKLMEEIGKEFEIHPIILEDLVNTEQRPRADEQDDYLSVVMKALSYNPRKRTIHDEHIGIVLGKNFVISFQEKKADTFESVRENLRKNKGRIRKMGADYLAYVLIDTVIDGYFVVLDKIGEKIEDAEEELVDDPSERTLHAIQQLKKDMLILRKAIWPMREVMGRLQRREPGRFRESTEIYLKDLYDHVAQVADTIDTFNNMLTNMLDVYLSSISNKTNEVMKVLAIFSTIFMPLTFLTGLYGMNFRFMPELEWEFGYFTILGVMAVLAVVMIWFYKKMEWI